MEKTSKEFIKWFPIEYCTECNSNSLMLITSKGNRCSINGYSDNITYDHILCTKCGAKYDIDWSDKTPKPLRNGSMEKGNFLYNWKH